MDNIKFYNGTYDLVFKEIMSERKICAYYVNELLDLNEKIKDDDIVYLNNESAIDGPEIKTSICDVKFCILNDYIVNMEMQREKPKYLMEDRLFFQACQLHSKGTVKGSVNYNKVRTYVICFAAYGINKNNWIRKLTLNDKEEYESDKFKIIIVDLTKTNKCVNIELRKCLEAFKLNSVTYSTRDSEVLKMIKEKITLFNEDDIKRLEQDDLIANQMAIETEKENCRLEGKIEGKIEGILEGETKAKKEMVIKLSSFGMKKEDISKALDLPLLEIEEYLK